MSESMVLWYIYLIYCVDHTSCSGKIIQNSFIKNNELPLALLYLNCPQEDFNGIRYLKFLCFKFKRKLNQMNLNLMNSNLIQCRYIIH
jgi:hypothetical protein